MYRDHYGRAEECRHNDTEEGKHAKNCNAGRKSWIFGSEGPKNQNCADYQQQAEQSYYAAFDHVYYEYHGYSPFRPAHFTTIRP